MSHFKCKYLPAPQGNDIYLVLSAINSSFLFFSRVTSSWIRPFPVSCLSVTRTRVPTWFKHSVENCHKMETRGKLCKSWEKWQTMSHRLNVTWCQNYQMRSSKTDTSVKYLNRKRYMYIFQYFSVGHLQKSIVCESGDMLRRLLQFTKRFLYVVPPVRLFSNGSVMSNSKYEYVRNFESDDRLLKNCWIVVRIDGKAFHK